MKVKVQGRGAVVLPVCVVAALVSTVTASIEYRLPASVEDSAYARVYTDLHGSGRFLLDDGPDHLLLFMDSAEESTTSYSRPAIRRIRRDTGEAIDLTSYGPTDPADDNNIRGAVRVSDSIWMVISEADCPAWNRTDWQASILTTGCMVLVQLDASSRQVLFTEGFGGFWPVSVTLDYSETVPASPFLYVSGDVYQDGPSTAGDSYHVWGDNLVAKIPLSGTRGQIAATTWTRHWGTLSHDHSHSQLVRIGPALFGVFGIASQCTLARLADSTGSLDGSLYKDLGTQPYGTLVQHPNDPSRLFSGCGSNIVHEHPVEVFETVVPLDRVVPMPSAYDKTLRLANAGEMRSMVYHKNLDLLIVSYGFRQLDSSDPMLPPGNSHIAIAFIRTDLAELTVVRNLIWDTGSTGYSRINHLLLNDDETQLYAAVGLHGSLAGSTSVLTDRAALIRIDMRAETSGDSNNDLLIILIAITAGVIATAVLGAAMMAVSKNRPSIDAVSNPRKQRQQQHKQQSVRRQPGGASAHAGQPAAGSTTSHKHGRSQRSGSNPAPRRPQPTRALTAASEASTDRQTLTSMEQGIYSSYPISALVGDGSRKSMSSHVTVTSEAAPYFG